MLAETGDVLRHATVFGVEVELAGDELQGNGEDHFPFGRENLKDGKSEMVDDGKAPRRWHIFLVPDRPPLPAFILKGTSETKVIGSLSLECPIVGSGFKEADAQAVGVFLCRDGCRDSVRRGLSPEPAGG